MELLINDLSIHEQFHNLSVFRQSLTRVMKMRKVARHFGRELYCHRMLLYTKPKLGVTLQQAISSFPSKDEVRAVMSWLTKYGPFWDDLRLHSEEDYWECCNEIVTDTAIGEAAFRNLHGSHCGLISLTPSNWCYSPVAVIRRQNDEEAFSEQSNIENWWSVEELKKSLEQAPTPISSWSELREISVTRFNFLRISETCFSHLDGVPFVKSSADRVLFLLDVLNEFAGSFDQQGKRTAKGHQIYREFFTGKGKEALFSDSSETERNKFRKLLMFANPDFPEQSIFCPWHGKESRSLLRIHFSWPIQAGNPVYVVYVGPKITKR